MADEPTIQVSLADTEADATNNANPDFDQYRRYGTFTPKEVVDKFFKFTLSEAYRSMGAGTYDNLLQNFLSRLDKHGTALTPLNTLNYGYTFITRPRLNLTAGNLRQHPVLSTLYTDEKDSVAFMMRALLDSRLSRGRSIYMGAGADRGYEIYDEAKTFTVLARQSGLFDWRNPFFVPLCNGLKGISGFPDFTIREETTEGDFHSGDFTFVKGSDFNNATQELTLEFRDVQGSIILSCIYIWCLVMALQAKGLVTPYPDDIYEQRLNYTVSIYRFITDPTRRNILWWAKATGCFPKSAPVGALFNVNQGEVTISSAMNFSVPFVANDVKINDPGILMDFNALVSRYCPDITNPKIFTNVKNDAALNFIGLPYIESVPNMGLELKWKMSDYYTDALPDIDGVMAGKVQQETKMKQQADIKKVSNQATAMSQINQMRTT